MKKISFKFRKGFFVFYGAFLALISVTAFPVLLYQGAYTEFFILAAVVCVILCFSLWLYRGFVAVATDFAISGETISFIYDNRIETVDLNELTEIGVSLTRYIFYGKKKHIVIRDYYKHLLPKEVDPRIYDVAAICQIPCVTKFY